MLQYRIAAGGGVRDVDEGKRQVLVTFPWEQIDTYNTDFSRDCFDEYLTSRLPVMCWQHDRKEPIGRATEWQKTASANEFVGQFSDFDAVPRARQAFAQIRDKEITDFSYAFDNAKAKPHPSGERGQMRFIHAGMPEFSPVTTGSIPGAIAIGVRSVDVAALRSMVDDEQITPEEARSILGLDVPIVGERETEEPIVPDKPKERERIIVEVPEGLRTVTLTVKDDGTISAESPAAPPAEPAAEPAGDGNRADSDAGQLASAIDAALDAYDVLIRSVDVTTLPEPVQQAIALADAAGVAADELLDAMGLPDPDDGDRAASKGDEVTVGKRKGTVEKVMPNGALLVDWGDGKKSLVAAADAETRDDDPADGDERADSKKPYGDVEYADPGYQSDKKKRYPLDTEEHVRAAWSYINQGDNADKYSAENLAKVKANIQAAAKKVGVEISDDNRSDADPETVDLESTRAALDLLATR